MRDNDEKNNKQMNGRIMIIETINGNQIGIIRNSVMHNRNYYLRTIRGPNCRIRYRMKLIEILVFKINAVVSESGILKFEKTTKKATKRRIGKNCPTV